MTMTDADIRRILADLQADLRAAAEEADRIARAYDDRPHLVAALAALVQRLRERFALGRDWPDA